VASPHMKRMARGVLAAAAVVVVATTLPVSASAAPGFPAQPPPANSSDAMKLFQELSKQAEIVHQDKLKAEEDQKVKQAEFDKATGDLNAAQQAEAQAKKDEEAYRGKVDALTNASFQGARFNKLSALLTGASAQDFLERASALNTLALDNRIAIDRFSAAIAQANDAKARATNAQQRAQEAKDATARLIADIAKREGELNGRRTDAMNAFNRLSASERKKLTDPGDDGTVYLPPAGAAGAAVSAALSKRGAPYVYGAAGPNQFDCSGLTMWSYAQGGVKLPRTAQAQMGVGSSVGYGQWQPGDLLFYGTASNIHHVSMYVGNGNVIHASTEGVPVKVVPVSQSGSDYYASRRPTA